MESRRPDFMVLDYAKYKKQCLVTDNYTLPRESRGGTRAVIEW